MHFARDTLPASLSINSSSVKAWREVGRPAALRAIADWVKVLYNKSTLECPWNATTHTTSITSWEWSEKSSWRNGQQISTWRVWIEVEGKEEEERERKTQKNTGYIFQKLMWIFHMLRWFVTPVILQRSLLLHIFSCCGAHWIMQFVHIRSPRDGICKYI